MSEGPKRTAFQFDMQDLLFMIVIGSVAGILLRVNASISVVVAWLVVSSLTVWTAIRARQPETISKNSRLD
jgi:uncharacterized membrane protein YcaP (DUF421 family)